MSSSKRAIRHIQLQYVCIFENNFYFLTDHDVCLVTIHSIVLFLYYKVGWLGYSDEKIIELSQKFMALGFNAFKMKVGRDVEDDKRRLG